MEALSAWVVSKHFSPEKNIADYYIEEVQGNPVALDSMDQAVAKYNRALEDALDHVGAASLVAVESPALLGVVFLHAGFADIVEKGCPAEP